jgi:hypothetical protein
MSSKTGIKICQRMLNSQINNEDARHKDILHDCDTAAYGRVTTHKTTFSIFAAVRTSNLVRYASSNKKKKGQPGSRVQCGMDGA